MNVEKTKFDNFTVEDVSKMYDKNPPTKETIENTVGQYGNVKLNRALTGTRPEQLVQFWSSYEDHIKRYEDEIKEYKASILYDIEVMKNLEKEKQEIIEEYEKMNLEELEPKYYPFQYSDNEELKKKCHDLVKSHEIHYHLDYLLDRKILNVRKINAPEYELLCDSNGKFKYIRCKKCFEKYILSKQELFKIDFDGTMKITGEIGSSENS